MIRFFAAAVLFFVFLANAHVTVLAPNGGESYQVGDTMIITWSSDETVHECYIKFSPDNGHTKITISGQYQIVKVDNPESWGTFKWKIPESLVYCVEQDNDEECIDSTFSTISSQCKIMIDNPYNDDANTYDFSDNVFAINPVAAEKKNDIRPSAMLSVSPLPFNSAAHCSFSLPEDGYVNISVVDLMGRNVATIADGKMSRGDHSAVWTAANVPAGVYLFRMQYGTETIVKTAKFVK